MEELIVGSTLVKKIINPGHEETAWCPRYVYEADIKKRINRYISEPMQYGIFGETLCIGSGAYDNLFDLPRDKRTKEGKKKKVQVSIENQAKHFPQIALEKNIAVYPGVNTQIPLAVPYDDNTIIQSMLDIFPTTIFWNNETQIAIIDIKFTSDINNTYGNFSWGAPAFIDHFQPDLYHWLVRNVDIDYLKNRFPHINYDAVFHEAVKNAIESNDIKFIYWIMGWKTLDPNESIKKQIKFIERGYTDQNGSMIRQEEMKMRISKAVKILRLAEAQNWPERPSIEWCKKCALAKHNNGNCKSSMEEETL